MNTENNTVYNAEVTNDIPADIKATTEKTEEKIATAAEAVTETKEEATEGSVGVEGSLNLGNRALVGFLRNSVISAPGIVFADKDTLAPVKSIKKELLPPKGYKVEVEGNTAKIDLFVYAVWGTSVPDAFEYIKKELEVSMHSMLGLDISEINMTVLDLLTQEDYDLVIKGA